MHKNFSKSRTINSELIDIGKYGQQSSCRKAIPYFRAPHISKLFSDSKLFLVYILLLDSRHQILSER